MMSRSTVAAVLSFVVPGAGLWYLGHRLKAEVNFLVAVVLTVVATMSSYEHVHYVFLAIAAGSAGYAHAVARADGSKDGSTAPGIPDQPHETNSHGV